jgi:hypothetical protein
LLSLAPAPTGGRDCFSKCAKVRPHLIQRRC